MNYTLNQLRIFLKVVQTLNVTAAARDLHLTQPAVSIQLQKFQQQFEIPLLEIIQKKIFVTEFGKEIAQAADRILAEAHALEFAMQAYKGQLTGKLKMSVVSTGKYVAPYFIADFMKQHQGIELFLDVTNKAQVLNSLERNKVDFALVSILPEKLDIDKVELMQNKLFLVGNYQQKFLKEEYDRKIFEMIPLIYREQGSGTRNVMENYIIGNKIKANKKMELTSNEAVKQAVIAGLGFSIMPLIGIRNEIQHRQLQIIPVKGFPIRSYWTLIWIRNKRFSPVAKAYLEYLRKEKDKIIQSKFDWYENF